MLCGVRGRDARAARNLSQERRRHGPSPEPGTQNPKPGTRNPNPKPGTRNPKPGMQIGRRLSITFDQAVHYSTAAGSRGAVLP
jgi:hypothetical protein